MGDRRMDMHCLDNIRLEPGDTLTFVAFNKARPTSTAGVITRGSLGHTNAGVYEEGLFAQSQHTIVRMDFVSDKALAATAAAAAAAAAAASIGQDGAPMRKGLRGSTITTTTTTTTTTSPNVYAPASMYVTQRWPQSTPVESCILSTMGKIAGDDQHRILGKATSSCEQKYHEHIWSARMTNMVSACPDTISLTPQP